MNAFRILCVVAAASAALIAPLQSRAAERAATPVQWTARDSAGRDVTVPAADRATVVAFLRIQQPQSADAVRDIRAVVEKQPATQVVVVLSGQNAPEAVGHFVQQQKIDWPVVLDPDYVLSGRMDVRVWPTTAVITAAGIEVAHLAGLPQSFAADLSAHLDFATNRIDRAALEVRLTTRQVVTDTPQQAAARHLRVATALLEKEQLDAARAEIEQGLRLQPEDVPLRLALVRTLLKQRQPEAALQALEGLKDRLPSWQANQLRAEALIALERWPEAKSAVAEAIKLNPNPAPALYLSGLVSSHEKDWPSAAAAFRKAYESAHTTREGARGR